MRLVDVHCHLESEEFTGKLPSLIEEAAAADVIKLVTCSITPSQWPVSQALAEEFAPVEFALGVHPWYLREEFRHDLPRLAEAATRGAVAIGEVGLDKKIDDPPFEMQRQFFLDQLRIAKDIDLPLIIHCRGAFDDLIAIVRKTGLPKAGAVLHNFSGSAEIAKLLIPYGALFSLGGALTYRNSRKKRDVLSAIYPDYFLLETDSPDIPPVEAKTRPNVPANIRFCLRAAAETLGTPEEDVAKHTTLNAARIFRWQS